MPKYKILPEEKIDDIHRFLSGEESMRQIAKRLDVKLASIQQWLSNYNSMGENTFLMSGHKHYSKELKEHAVLEYLTGTLSQQKICEKYGILKNSVNAIVKT